MSFLLLAACPSNPEPGSEGGPCYPNSTCNAGLVCVSDRCARSSETDAGALRDAGMTDAGTTDAGTPDAGQPDAGTPDAGPTCSTLLPSSGDPQVDACAATRCCAQINRCIGDPACAQCAPNGLATCTRGQRAGELDLCVRENCLPLTSLVCGGPATADARVAACLSSFCCVEVDACLADGVCLNCLAATGTACLSNPAYIALNTCARTSCPIEGCGTGVFIEARTPASCARCREPVCCTQHVACAGGVVPPSPTDRQACAACVADSSSAGCVSASPSIQQGARDVLSCVSSTCAAECAPKGALPTVRTVSAGLMPPDLISINGEVVDEGDSFVRDRGVCFGATPAPTIPCAPAPTSGTGAFALLVRGTAPGAVHYLRAYAENASGRAYGADVIVRTLYPGDTFEGGIIFHTTDGIHGLIAAPSDQTGFIRWWDTNTRPTPMTTGAVATAVGTGNANTNAIVAAQGSGSYAAKVCADLTLNQRSDWYLPSKDELDLMYVNRAAIGNLNTAGYWSSSEVGTSVWIQNLATGFQQQVPSSNANAVRAIRSF